MGYITGIMELFNTGKRLVLDIKKAREEGKTAELEREELRQTIAKQEQERKDLDPGGTKIKDAPDLREYANVKLGKTEEEKGMTREERKEKGYVGPKAWKTRSDIRKGEGPTKKVQVTTEEGRKHKEQRLKDEEAQRVAKAKKNLYTGPEGPLQGIGGIAIYRLEDDDKTAKSEQQLYKEWKAEYNKLSAEEIEQFKRQIGIETAAEKEVIEKKAEVSEEAEKREVERVEEKEKEIEPIGLVATTQFKEFFPEGEEIETYFKGFNYDKALKEKDRLWEKTISFYQMKGLTRTEVIDRYENKFLEFITPYIPLPEDEKKKKRKFQWKPPKKQEKPTETSPRLGQ